MSRSFVLVPIDSSRSGKPLQFLDETYPAKTRGMELPCGENSIILTSTVFNWLLLLLW